MLCVLIALILTGGLAGFLSAQNVEEVLTLPTGDEQFIEGQVDWTDRILTVYGEGVAPEGVTNPVRQRLMGFRAAKAVAFRNLLELVGEVHVDARTKVSMAMVTSDTIHTRITGILQGARVVPESQQEKDGLYRLALQLDLANQFADAVLPEGQLPELEPLPEPEPLFADEADSLADAPIAYETPKPYTGLLVDARGLDLQPSMAPRILNDAGLEIYGSGYVNRSYATRMGVVGYHKDMDQALTSDRLGGAEAHPLVVEAHDVSGYYYADAVISDEESVWVRMADAKQGFLAEGRVVFLVGPEPVVEPVPGDSLYFDSTYVDTSYWGGEDLDLPEETGPVDYPE